MLPFRLTTVYRCILSIMLLLSLSAEEISAADRAELLEVFSVVEEDSLEEDGLRVICFCLLSMFIIARRPKQNPLP
jgi:hypothetical protein